MAVRLRYFPAFLAVAFLGLLCIPIYYVDLWSNEMATSRLPEMTSLAQQQEQQQQQKREDSDKWRQEKSQLGLRPAIVVNSSSNDFVTSIVRLNNAVAAERNSYVQLPGSSSRIIAAPGIMRPQAHHQPPLIGRNVVRRGHNRNTNNGNLNDRYGVDLVTFALRIARDRLRIEKYGATALRRRPSFANEIGYNDTEAEAKAAAEDAAAPRTDVIIVTYLRGGTTFFGDLLNEYPGTFYHFEPLHSVTENDQVASDEEVSKAMHILRSLVRCDYDNLTEYIDHVREPDHRFLFEHNRRLWFTCQFHSALCYNTRFLSSVCRLHPVHVTKLVRLRLAEARKLMDEFPNLKVIYLVRDPRGLYSSRRNLGWCNLTRSCIDPYSYCEDMRQDIAVAAHLKSTMPDRFLAVRYEDMSIDTENQVTKVLDFLHLEAHPRLKRFILSHTKLRAGENAGGPYSTKRDSKKVPFSWKRNLTPEEIDYVEDACSDVIRRLNFT